MIKFKMDVTMTQEKDGVRLNGPMQIDGMGATPNEVLCIASVFADALERCIPAIEKCPRITMLDFVKELNRPFDEWASKQ